MKPERRLRSRLGPGQRGLGEGPGPAARYSGEAGVRARPSSTHPWGPALRPRCPHCGCSVGAGSTLDPSSERSLWALTPTSSGLTRAARRSCYEACEGHGRCLISPKGEALLFGPVEPSFRFLCLRSTWRAC